MVVTFHVGAYGGATPATLSCLISWAHRSRLREAGSVDGTTGEQGDYRWLGHGQSVDRCSCTKGEGRSGIRLKDFPFPFPVPCPFPAHRGARWLECHQIGRRLTGCAAMDDKDDGPEAIAYLPGLGGLV